MLKVGIDVGSTTIKCIVLDQKNKILFETYRRHMADILSAFVKIVKEIAKKWPQEKLNIGLTGSASMGLAEALELPFFQEVICEIEAVKKYFPQADVIVELGGEDAKVVFLKPTPDPRMNTACAGGTGAFIDQMATLLKTDPSGLNKLARSSTQSFDLAARCGVFAKTDLQALLNNGVSKPDIAASVFQAVVNQTIGGLAQGRPLRGNIVFLGGPLHYNDQLSGAFVKTLKLKEDQALIPEEGHLFVAMGAALMTTKKYLARRGKKVKLGSSRRHEKAAALTSDSEKTNLSSSLKEVKSNWTAPDLLQKIAELDEDALNVTTCLEPLFKDEKELKQFRARHQKNKVARASLTSQKGNVFLGFDAGSTTSKLVLINSKGSVLYEDYRPNQGDPLQTAQEMLVELWSKLPSGLKINYSLATGYGEQLLKAGLAMDDGEVETVCHFTAAKHFCPKITFLVDIGGQDMKAMRIVKGVIDDILLNEACSSGCGSFIETLAESLNLQVADFAEQALSSQKPVDLGYRCTVFMNTSIKQAQKEGATAADIAAGLAHAVVKNALYKVMRFKNAESLGKAIVVQGGTFNNEAILRAFELETGVEVIRPDIAGMMGAYGAALLARDRWLQLGEKKRMSTLLSAEGLKNLTRRQQTYNCGGCDNHCQLTASIFSDGRRFVSGNRCERGAGLPLPPPEKRIPNLYEEREQMLFDYEALDEEQAPRGIIGLPRVLNLAYEHYPLWHTFFTELGFRVVLSPRSNKQIYNLGMETITSDSICYPAKLVNGHLIWLVNEGVADIFFPAIVFERDKIDGAQNKLNCPVITGYPEVMKHHIEAIKSGEVNFIHPFLNMSDKPSMVKEMQVALAKWQIPEREIKTAMDKADRALTDFKRRLAKRGEEVVAWVNTHLGSRAIVLAGRPYHTDPEINSGLAKILISEGMAVLSEDSVAHLGKVPRPLRVLDQWSFHGRIYAAASFVATQDRIDLVQLNSFGCGLDAIIVDQTKEIIQANHKIYTVLKIDESSNLGAIRIRLRSLKHALTERQTRKSTREPLYAYRSSPKFELEDKKRRTILAPQMSPIHFDLVEAAFRASGFDLKVLPEVSKKDIDTGLKYVNNDVCYPAILTVGQLVNALETGEYDLDKVAVIMTQTGGACRASNYLGLIKKAVQDANLEQVPLLSLNALGWEKQPGFKLSLPTLNRLIMAVVLGDLVMKVSYKKLPYEKNKGEVKKLEKEMLAEARKVVASGSLAQYQKLVKKIVRKFAALEVKEELKVPRVGIVGEILVKFHPDANHHLVDKLQSKGVEVVMPELADFFLYTTQANVFGHQHLAVSRGGKQLSMIIRGVVEMYRAPVRRALAKEGRGELGELTYIEDLVAMAEPIISTGINAGEGWFLTAEIIKLIEAGVPNVLCLQPFACLPNHIVGRGMLGPIREKYGQVNLAALDYDPGTTKVANSNRIELFLSSAWEITE